MVEVDMVNSAELIIKVAHTYSGLPEKSQTHAGLT
jgi:hypothetical protein